MPLLFSYGTLQQDDVQLSTFGRLLQGEKDELPGYEPSSIRIEDPEEAAATGRTHHANVTFNGRNDSRVRGTVFDITDAELAAADEYEDRAAYNRVAVTLASGKQAWVYVGHLMNVKRAEPESLRGRNLQASLTVKDLQKSLAWYQDFLGFTIDRKHERDGKLLAVSLKAGDVRILINQDDGAKGWDRPKGEGFSLQITTAQDVDAIAKRIKDHGGALDLEPTDMPLGARVFRVRDPDGFRFAISTERRAEG